MSADAVPAAGEDVLAATARCMSDWLGRVARASGGEVRHVRGLQCAEQRAGVHEIVIAFPALPGPELDAALDAVLAHAARLRAERLGCWSLHPTTPEDLDARLVRRGFDPGWWPHWMSRATAPPPAVPHPPAGVEIAEVSEPASWPVRDLPYHEPAGAEARHRLTRVIPQEVWHFAALADGGEPVGHSTLSVSGHTAGIFDVGVVPGRRRSGIGAAMMWVVIEQARQAGCRRAVVNATGEGEPLYARLGFRSHGYGRTWWADRPPASAR